MYSKESNPDYPDNDRLSALLFKKVNGKSDSIFLRRKFVHK